MTTLPEFLLARVAEEEELALDAAGWDRSGTERATGRWSRVGMSSLEDDEHRSVIHSDNNQLTGAVADHIARHDPAHVLARCKVNRRIVDDWVSLAERLDDQGRPLHLFDPVTSMLLKATDPWLRALASVYANHPDYCQEWRP